MCLHVLGKTFSSHTPSCQSCCSLALGHDMFCSTVIICFGFVNLKEFCYNFDEELSHLSCFYATSMEFSVCFHANCSMLLWLQSPDFTFWNSQKNIFDVHLYPVSSVLQPCALCNIRSHQLNNYRQVVVGFFLHLLISNLLKKWSNSLGLCHLGTSQQV